MHHINPWQFHSFELSVSQSLRRFAMPSMLNTNWLNQFADFVECINGLEQFLESINRIKSTENEKSIPLSKLYQI